MFIGSCNGVVHAIDRLTGQATWKYNALQDGGKQAEFHGIPVILEDLVVFGNDDRNPRGVGYVYAFEQKTGNVRWKYRAGAGVMADLVREGDRLYVVTLGDELVCLDISTGRQNWRFSTGWVNEKMSNVMAAPAVIEGRVLFGGQNGVVHALDARSGQLIWKRDVGAPVITPLVAAPDAVYFGTFDQRIHRLALGPDAVHAELELGGVLFGPPTLLGDSLALLVYDNPDTASLKSVDLALKGVRWSREIPGGWSSARAYLWHGSLLAGSKQGTLAAFSSDGSEGWSDTVGGVIRGIGVADDVLYVGTLKGAVIGYRPLGFPTGKTEAFDPLGYRRVIRIQDARNEAITMLRNTQWSHGRRVPTSTPPSTSTSAVGPNALPAASNRSVCGPLSKRDWATRSGAWPRGAGTG